MASIEILTVLGVTNKNSILTEPERGRVEIFGGCDTSPVPTFASLIVMQHGREFSEVQMKFIFDTTQKTFSIIWKTLFPPDELEKCLLSDIKECNSAPCLNGGSCIDLLSGYKCNCMAGYTGRRCEKGKNSAYLSNIAFYGTKFLL